MGVRQSSDFPHRNSTSITFRVDLITKHGRIRRKNLPRGTEVDSLNLTTIKRQFDLSPGDEVWVLVGRRLLLFEEATSLYVYFSGRSRIRRLQLVQFKNGHPPNQLFNQLETECQPRVPQSPHFGMSEVAHVNSGGRSRYHRLIAAS